MGKSIQIACLACLAIILSGCGPSAVFEVVERPGMLSRKAGDKLFELKLIESSEAMSLETLLVSVGAPGTTDLVINFDLAEDTNGDGKLDVGDTLLAVEPALNEYDGDSVGKTFNVGVAQLKDGVHVQIWTGAWQAK